jgi:hypothetical protein
VLLADAVMVFSLVLLIGVLLNVVSWKLSRKP